MEKLRNKEKREVYVAVRCTKEEKESIWELAKAKGETLSDYIRLLIIEDIDSQRVDTDDN